MTALLAKIQGEYKLTVNMVSSGPSLIYSSYMPKTTTPERMSMPLDQLIAFVSKKPIGEQVDVLTLEALCENEGGGTGISHSLPFTLRNRIWGDIENYKRISEW